MRNIGVGLRFEIKIGFALFVSLIPQDGFESWYYRIAFSSRSTIDLQSDKSFIGTKSEITFQNIWIETQINLMVLHTAFVFTKIPRRRFILTPRAGKLVKRFVEKPKAYYRTPSTWWSQFNNIQPCRASSCPIQDDSGGVTATYGAHFWRHFVQKCHIILNCFIFFWSVALVIHKH
jgi:hypothetical protein